MENTSPSHLRLTLNKASLAELAVGCKEKARGIKSTSYSVQLLIESGDFSTVQQLIVPVRSCFFKVDKVIVFVYALNHADFQTGNAIGNLRRGIPSSGFTVTIKTYVTKLNKSGSFLRYSTQRTEHYEFAHF